ncbi:Uncharacterised protein [Fusobacterium necrophorum subsp. necrophorum]|nr:Uncharacterised protein [Fusobacterium necrophorum subsp. necrophorum]
MGCHQQCCFLPFNVFHIRCIFKSTSPEWNFNLKGGDYVRYLFGFVTALAPINLLAACLSVSIGIIIGALPGLSAAMELPF